MAWDQQAPEPSGLTGFRKLSFRFGPTWDRVSQLMKIDVIGHLKQRTALAQLVKAGRLPHALLFTGPVGVGKCLVALELCRTLLCLDPEKPYGGCGTCKSCTLVAAKTHPDLHRLDCQADEALDQLRGVLQLLMLKSFDGSKRIALIREAEYMSTQAANTILKALEEPRPETHFILIASNATRLPTTVLSRCQRWFFHELERDDVRRALEGARARGELESTDAELSVLTELSGGSLASLAGLLEHRETWSGFATSLSDLLLGRGAVVNELAEVLAKDKEALSGHLHSLLTLAHTRLRSVDDDSQRLLWARLLENLLRADYLIAERNLAPGAVLRAALSASCGDSRLHPAPMLEGDEVLLSGWAL